jgi:hypothetical protein
MRSPPGREAARPDPTLAGWSKFIGEWDTLGSHPYLPDMTLHGRTSFAWLEGGAFVIMRSEIAEPGIPSGIAVFGSDDGTGEHFMLYFDERGVSRRYNVEPSRDGWTWWRNTPDFAQRFTLSLSSDERTILGKGVMSKNGGPWEGDLELTFTKAGVP